MWFQTLKYGYKTLEISIAYATQFQELAVMYNAVIFEHQSKMVKNDRYVIISM